MGWAKVASLRILLYEKFAVLFTLYTAAFLFCYQERKRYGQWMDIPF
jgi:hypothetical protein